MNTDTSGPLVALTFDDGPADQCSTLLDILAAEGVHATFFLIGSRAAESPSLVRHIADAGHAIGNHTFTHPHLTTLNPAEQATEIDRCDEAIVAAGAERPRLCRPPFGEYDAVTLSLLASRGKVAVMWDVDTEDWSMHSAQETRERARGARDGSVILMHDFPPQTSEALPDIIAEFKGRHARFVTVPQLIEHAASVRPGAVVYSRYDIR